MEKVDLKDRKILYHLDLDSRQSFSQIGKKVGLHKDVVAYRVKNLQEKGIIKNFYAHINHQRFTGYAPIRCYISYENISPDIRKEIIEYLVKSKYTPAVSTLEGSYDLVFFIRAKNFPEVYMFWEKMLKKYRNYISKKILSIYYHEVVYSLPFLLDEKDRKKSNKIILSKWHDSGNIGEYDDLDYQICKLIYQNSRIPTIDIATKLNSTAVTIQNRIKKRTEKDMILGFRLNIDWAKLGYHHYKADIELKKSDNYDSIIRYVESNPNLLWSYKSLGYVDLEFVFLLNNAHQLHQIMEDISIKYPDSIKNYTYFSIMEVHKIQKF